MLEIKTLVKIPSNVNYKTRKKAHFFRKRVYRIRLNFKIKISFLIITIRAFYRVNGIQKTGLIIKKRSRRFEGIEL